MNLPAHMRSGLHQSTPIHMMKAMGQIQPVQDVKLHRIMILTISHRKMPWIAFPASERQENPVQSWKEACLLLKADWMNIGCSICHQPIGDSYATGISYWDQASRSYVAVENISELCAKCHEGSHGFEVTEEQEASIAHNHWQCNQCHGNHGAPSACTDCHDPQAVSGAAEHAQHPSVNCTACHDAGSLVIWQEEIRLHPIFPITFPYVLHMPSLPGLHTTCPKRSIAHVVITPKIRTHQFWFRKLVARLVMSEGASLFWCEFFNRDEDPNADPISYALIQGYPGSIGNRYKVDHYEIILEINTYNKSAEFDIGIHARGICTNAGRWSYYLSSCIQVKGRLSMQDRNP